MARKWFILGRHNFWVDGARITESESTDGKERRFTATINGWQGFHIWQGETGKQDVELIKLRVRKIRDYMNKHKGDDRVFYSPFVSTFVWR